MWRKRLWSSLETSLFSSWKRLWSSLETSFFFFLWARLRSSLETSFFLCRKWLRSSLRRRFFSKVGGGLRLNSEGAVRALKYMNPGDKSIGAVSPDVTPAAPILSDVRPVPSHRPPPPPPTPPSPDPSPRSLSPKFCAKRFSSISRRGLRAWTCRRGKIQGADAGYSNPRASHPEALSLQLIRGVLGALVLQIFRPKSALKPDVFSKIMSPKIAKFFDNWGGGGAQRARIRVADVCPSNFPPSAGPGDETTRRYGRKTFAAKIFARNVFRPYLVVVFAAGPADGGKFKGQTLATRIRARRTQKP